MRRPKAALALLAVLLRLGPCREAYAQFMPSYSAVKGGPLAYLSLAF